MKYTILNIDIIAMTKTVWIMIIVVIFLILVTKLTADVRY